jgi:uncharacterized membrane protein YhiD involved in acid resistance
MRYVIILAMGMILHGLGEFIIELTPGAGVVAGSHHIWSGVLFAVLAMVVVKVAKESELAPVRQREADRAMETREMADAMLRREGVDSIQSGWKECTGGDYDMMSDPRQIQPGELD